MHPPKKPIVLLSDVVPGPTTVQRGEVTNPLVARIRDHGRKAGGHVGLEREWVEEVEEYLGTVETPSEKAVADKQETLIPCGKQTKFEVHLVGTWVRGCHVAAHVAIRNWVRLFSGRNDRRVRGRNALDHGE